MHDENGYAYQAGALFLGALLVAYLAGRVAGANNAYGFATALLRSVKRPAPRISMEAPGDGQ